MTIRPARALILLALPVALLGCPDAPGAVAPGAVAPGATAPGATAAGAPRALLPLSELGSASWSDLAVGADGALHAIYQDAPKGGVAGVYHRSSADGGTTWAEPVRLNEADHHAGMPRLAVDGAGRVHAFWKDMSAHEGGWLAAGTGDHPSGGAYGRPLVGAVLEGGGWSPPFRVSPSAQVVSWFVAVDPKGQVHLVWSEAIKAPNGYQTIEPALVMQAQVAGRQVGAPKELYRGAPANPPDYDGSAWYYESILGLRGHVDAAGTARFVATRRPAKADATDVALWDGKAFTRLVGYDAYATTGAYYNPPELVLDDAGREHVLVQDARSAKKGLLDFPVGGGDPVPVRQAADATGEIKAFQVARGPGGKLAAMVALRDRSTPGTEFELYVTRYEGGAWTPAVDVTQNALRGTFKEFGSDANGTKVATSYEPAFSAGAFDATGKLALVIVNQEKVSVSMTDTATYTGDRAVTGGLVAIPKVYFARP